MARAQNEQDDRKRELAALAGKYGYKVHPLANLFPLLEGDEFEDLSKDIKANGAVQPILTHGGFILDGRNRLLASKKAGVKPRFEKADLGSRTAEGLIWSLNTARRHLTPGQIAALKVQYEAAALRAEGLRRKSEGGRKAGGPGRKKQLSAKSSKPAFDARQRMASAAGISQHQIGMALNLERWKPELLPQVASGKVKLSDAVRQALPIPPKKAARRESRARRKARQGMFELAWQVGQWRKDIVHRKNKKKQTPRQILDWLVVQFDRVWFREELADWVGGEIENIPIKDDAGLIRMLGVLRDDDAALPIYLSGDLHRELHRSNPTFYPTWPILDSEDEIETYADAVKAIEKWMRA